MSKKSMPKPAANGVVSFFRSFFGKKNAGQNPENVQKISSRRYTSYSEEKQKKIQNFCDQLFEQQELITSGRLQLIGLDKVKKRLGKTWEGLKPIVYQTVEEAAEKYLDPRDLLIRYKDDTFLVVFAQDKSPIAEAKVMLIVEEIRKALFEHEEKELRKIDVRSAVTEIKPSHFKEKKYTPESINEAMEVAFVEKEECAQKENRNFSEEPTNEKKKIELPKAVEVETASPKKPLEKQESKDIVKSIYMPLWDVKNGALTTYIYHPSFAQHINSSEMSKEDIAKLDVAVLNEALRCIDALVKDNKRLLVLCPVHFDTLNYGANNEKYRIACQSIDEECKQLLNFLVTDFPSDADARKNDFKKKIAPFKNFSSSFWVEWRVRAKIDVFDILNEIGFSTAVCTLNPYQDEAWNIKNMEEFVSLAQESTIKQTAALGISSLSLTTSAVCSGFNYIGGSAIHDYVDFPDNVYRFQNEDLFSSFFEES